MMLQSNGVMMHVLRGGDEVSTTLHDHTPSASEGAIQLISRQHSHLQRGCHSVIEAFGTKPIGRNINPTSSVHDKLTNFQQAKFRWLILLGFVAFSFFKLCIMCLHHSHQMTSRIRISVHSNSFMYPSLS